MHLFIYQNLVAYIPYFWYKRGEGKYGSCHERTLTLATKFPEVIRIQNGYLCSIGGSLFHSFKPDSIPSFFGVYCVKTKQILGLPWWSSDSESALQCRGLSSICGPGIKIPCGPEQRRPGATTCCAATRDPMRPN